MLFGVFLLSLVAVAHAQPPYADAVDNIEEAIDQLKQQILSMDGNIPNITDSRRHYAVLLTHIAQVAGRLALNCEEEYEEVYIEELPGSIAIGFTSVFDVISVTNTAIKSLDSDTITFQALMKTLCPESSPALNTRNEVCNQMVDRAVKGDPARYSEEALITLTAGVVARELLDADLISTANDHDEVDYLLNSMDDLEDLISDLIDLIRLIEGESRCV